MKKCDLCHKSDKVHFRVDKFINTLLIGYQNCMEKNKKNCKSFNGILVNKKNIYYILKRDK